MAAASEKARRRWFRITPDRCVLALLALEGFLLLSAWFRWFPFNQHKGWTVLITIASVGLALVLMFLWFLAALVFRLRFQFGILSLLLLVVVVAVPCKWLATEMKAAREQREAVDWIAKVDGGVRYDYEFDSAGAFLPNAKPPGPPWERKLLGDGLFMNVTCVTLPNIFPASRQDQMGELIPALKKLKYLERIRLEGTSCVFPGFVEVDRGRIRAALPGVRVRDSGD